MRRALHRAREGVTLNLEEATTLLHAEGDDLDELCLIAGNVRDRGLEAAGFAVSRVPGFGRKRHMTIGRRL